MADYWDPFFNSAESEKKMKNVDWIRKFMPQYDTTSQLLTYEASVWVPDETITETLYPLGETKYPPVEHRSLKVN